MVTSAFQQDLAITPEVKVCQGATAQGMASRSSKTRITPFTKKNMKQRDPQRNPSLEHDWLVVSILLKHISQLG